MLALAAVIILYRGLFSDQSRNYCTDVLYNDVSGWLLLTVADSAVLLHRSVGMYKWVQSTGTLGPMLESLSYKAQHQHGLRSANVNVLPDSFASPGDQEGELLPVSHAQKQRTAECVRTSSAPGVWLYSRGPANAGSDTGNGWDFHSRVHKLLNTQSWSRLLSTYCTILWSLCWIVAVFSSISCGSAHVRLFIVSCVICKILYINNIFFIMV